MSYIIFELKVIGQKLHSLCSKENAKLETGPALKHLVLPYQLSIPSAFKATGLKVTCFNFALKIYYILFLLGIFSAAQFDKIS